MFPQRLSFWRLQSQNLVQRTPFSLQEQEALAHVLHPQRTVYSSGKGLCPTIGSSNSLSRTNPNDVGSGLSKAVINTQSISLVAMHALRMWALIASLVGGNSLLPLLWKYKWDKQLIHCLNCCTFLGNLNQVCLSFDKLSDNFGSWI